MSHYSEWKMQGASIKLIKNNLNGVYSFTIWTGTGYKFELILEEPTTQVYQSENFHELNRITQKQSEIDVAFSPRTSLKNCECPICKTCFKIPLIPKDDKHRWLCVR
ncbi:MAG: hypothetical protein ACXAC2_20370 [Candidatus Kariarchaeaceae archaeon]